LKVDDAAATATLRDALFKTDAGGTVDATARGTTVRFEYRDDATGLSARKEFVFEPASFIVRVTAQVTSGGRSLNPTIEWTRAR
jgi:hypothetical protein